MNKILFATTAFMAAAGAVAAADVRPYVGVDYTYVSAKYDNSAKVGGTNLFDDGLNGVTPYAGLQLNKYVGVEASYLYTENGEEKDILGSGINTKVRISGLSADVVGTLPVTEDDKFALLGSAGIGRYHARYAATGALTGTGSNDDTAYRLGAGAQYQINDKVGIRAMARYIDVDFDNTTDYLVTGNVGVNYKF